MKCFLSAGIVTAVAVGMLGGACIGESARSPDTTAVVGDTGPGAGGALLTCDPETGFDPEPGHHSARRRISPGVVVSIVPHTQSNQYSIPDLWDGRVVAKFVNHGNEPYEPLQLSAGGQSCLAIRSAVVNGNRMMVAEALAPGSQTGRRLRGLNLELHDTTNKTPLARWINVSSRDFIPVANGMTGSPVMQLIGFSAAVQDSAPAPGPGAWVTCVTNGCCRVSAEE